MADLPTRMAVHLRPSAAWGHRGAIDNIGRDHRVFYTERNVVAASAVSRGNRSGSSQPSDDEMS